MKTIPALSAALCLASALAYGAATVNTQGNDNTFTGVNTFTQPIVGSVTGSAATATDPTALRTSVFTSYTGGRAKVSSPNTWTAAQTFTSATITPDVPQYYMDGQSGRPTLAAWQADNTIDVTAAMRAWIAYSVSKALTLNPTGESNGVGRVELKLPPGAYVMTSPLILSTDFPGRTMGFTIKGAGTGVSQILYEPSGSSPFIYNNDKLLGVRFYGMSFWSNSASVPFMYSVSSGGAQDYYFEDCTWSGTWQYGFRLKGSNCNSEMGFHKCAFIGSWTAFLFSEDSDQFLNYWFTQCKYWTSYQWVKMTKGGNVKITDCDVSGYSPSTYTYLFSLEGASHAYGVCSFVVTGTRFELKNANAGLMYSEWPQGNILFAGCDTSSSTFAVSAFNTVTVVLSNVGGPVIKWLNCSLMGTHTYQAAIAQWQYLPRISYDSCQITHFAKPSDFIVTTAPSGNPGGIPNIKMTSCMGNAPAGTYEVFDSDQQWHTAMVGMTTRKIVRLAAASTSAPISGGSVTVKLPLHAIITKIWMVNVAGSTTNVGSYNYVVRTGEATPTVLAQASGNPLSNGFAISADPLFVCGTDAQRTITLIDLQNITNVGTNYFLIEYIG